MPPLPPALRVSMVVGARVRHHPYAHCHLRLTADQAAYASTSRSRGSQMLIVTHIRREREKQARLTLGSEETSGYSAQTLHRPVISSAYRRGTCLVATVRCFERGSQGRAAKTELPIARNPKTWSGPPVRGRGRESPPPRMLISGEMHLGS